MAVYITHPIRFGRVLDFAVRAANPIAARKVAQRSYPDHFISARVELGAS